MAQLAGVCDKVATLSGHAERARLMAALTALNVRDCATLAAFNGGDMVRVPPDMTALLAALLQQDGAVTGTPDQRSFLFTLATCSVRAAQAAVDHDLAKVPGSQVVAKASSRDEEGEQLTREYTATIGFTASIPSDFFLSKGQVGALARGLDKSSVPPWFNDVANWQPYGHKKERSKLVGSEGDAAALRVELEDEHDAQTINHAGAFLAVVMRVCNGRVCPAEGNPKRRRRSEYLSRVWRVGWGIVMRARRLSRWW
jgi:hypothetical protein